MSKPIHWLLSKEPANSSPMNNIGVAELTHSESAAMRFRSSIRVRSARDRQLIDSTAEAKRTRTTDFRGLLFNADVVEELHELRAGL